MFHYKQRDLGFYWTAFMDSRTIFWTSKPISFCFVNFLFGSKCELSWLATCQLVHFMSYSK